MPDPKRIGISGQARGIDPQRQRRNSFTTDEAVAAPLTLNQRGQITIQVSGPFQVDAEGNLSLNVAPPLTVTNNSPLTLGLALDPSLAIVNGRLVANVPKANAGRAGLAPALTAENEFLSGDGTYKPLPVGDHGALTGLADNDHVLYLDIEDYQQTIGANPDQCYIANCRTGVALATLTLTANRTYWIPFVAPVRGGTLGDVRVQITTAAAGENIRVALYDCVSDGADKPLTSDFRPSGSALVSATQSTASTGTFVLPFATPLTAGRLYWYCLMSSGAPAIRAVSTNEADMGLGWAIPSGTTAPSAITYWYETITYSSGLPTKAGTESYTNGTGAAPAIFHTWSA
jgi:hypothetical protein